MILDVLKTAARFPKREGVLKCFNLGEFEYPEYAALKSSIEAMPPALIPEIDDFVFGADEEEVKRKINEISGTYLFVDFGDIASTRSEKGTITDAFQISLTVARKVSSSDLDMIATAVVFERMLQHVAAIKKALLAETKNHPWLAEIDWNSDFSPFVARELGSIGWSLIFERKGLDLLQVK